MISSMTITPATSGASAITLHASTGTRQLSQIDGLTGPPAPRDVTRPLPVRDGIVDDSRYLDARGITLEGEIWESSAGASISTLSAISEAFSSSLISPALLKWTYDNGDARQCYVKLNGNVQTSLSGAGNLIQYQVQLRAPDPRIYSQTLQSVTLGTVTSQGSTSSSSNLVNSGNAPTPVSIVMSAGNLANVMNTVTVTSPTAYSAITGVTTQTLTGSSPWPSIASPTYLGFPLQVNQTITIDTGARTIVEVGGRSGVPQTLAASSAWPILYPGTSTATWANVYLPSGTTTYPTCTFNYRNAYW
jgi:Phage tail protein